MNRTVYTHQIKTLSQDRILIFSDHTGIERFFLRVGGTADEFQIWFGRWADRSKQDTHCVSIAWEHCGPGPEPDRPEVEKCVAELRRLAASQNITSLAEVLPAA